MKFKVGDKVKFNIDNHQIADEFGFDHKKTYEVHNVFHPQQTVQLKNDEGIYHAFFCERLELVEPKKTKNQRITELEETTKHFRNELDRAFEIEQEMKKVQALQNDDIQELIMNYQKLDKRIVGLENAIAEQIQLNNEQAKVNGSIIGKLNEAYEKIKSFEFVLAEKSKIIGIKPSMVVFDEIVPKSPNQQRAEIIEKAKKFVEEHAVSKAGADGFNYTSIDGWITYTEFVVNTEKRTVVLLAKGVHTHRVHHRSIAKCNPSDVFNEHIGKAIALGRALGIDVSEFENVVQPCELVVGQVCEIFDWDGHNGKHTKIVRVFDGGKANHSYYVGWLDKNNLKIINDTNAIY